MKLSRCLQMFTTCRPNYVVSCPLVECTCTIPHAHSLDF